MKLAIVATHPIQYQVPWYRALEATPGVDLTVYFALLPDATQQAAGFGVPFQWDIPLLDGYRWRLLPSRSSQPSLVGFFGLDTPSIHDTLAADRPDAVVITGWHARPMLQALLACIRLGIPRVIRGEANAMRRRPWWVRMLHRALLSRYDAFLAIGRSSRDFYTGYGISEDRIFAAPYSVDNERFQRDATTLAPDRDELRAAWGVPRDATCFLFAGKLEPKKRPLDVLAALDLARQAATVHLLVVGAGELEASARALVAAHRLPVTFCGFLNQGEIAGAYVASDCLVLPSDHGETWGLVVNEAMACGRPVIVSDRVGCGPDLVTSGVTGFTFPFADVGALAERMAHAARDPHELAAMGDRARERVGAYSIAEVVRGTLAAAGRVTRRR